jgi:hypothetical protein
MGERIAAYLESVMFVLKPEKALANVLACAGAAASAGYYDAAGVAVIFVLNVAKAF